MVHEMDLSVGKLVKALADKNMLDNTVLVFSSDNGGPAAGFKICTILCITFIVIKVIIY